MDHAHDEHDAPTRTGTEEPAAGHDAHDDRHGTSHNAGHGDAGHGDAHGMAHGARAAGGAGHDKHAGHSVAMFRDKFWLSLALTIPVVLLSHDVQEWLGYTVPMFPGHDYAAGDPRHDRLPVRRPGLPARRASASCASGQPGMMTLISLAIVVAFVTSWAGTLGLFEVEIWWELATLITIMLLGHWLEMRSIAQARGALTALAELLPDTAERVDGDATASRPARRASRGRRRAGPARQPASRPTASSPTAPPTSTNR